VLRHLNGALSETRTGLQPIRASNPEQMEAQMLRASRRTKPSISQSRKLLSLDQAEDLWLCVEEAADSDDPEVLRAGFEAAFLLLCDVERRGLS